ncbi:MAG TPA: threonine--tRNA ligase [Candidatus Fimimonas gallinarum]|uniref:Threonine--tRNA ligase n=1 Tax=Candidatus Fimimonas gallinarum TaxID=2840821 RepID=A0A9D1E462_9BACT|nr:threonine--tRNA ligase [Candidatus Fimimonas gallinarum]
MINIKLPDGSVKQFEQPVSCLAIAESISAGLARNAVCAEVNGVLCDLSHIVDADADYTVHTLKDEEGLAVLRHSTAHLMAQAISHLWKNAKFAIGPSIKNGFYYDIDFEGTVIAPEDLEKIEAEMTKIVKEDLPIVREEMSREEAIEFFRKHNDTYKVEILSEMDSPVVSLYRQGDYVDLCRGPHMPSTGRLKVFKLTSIAGAYWRGDTKNKMLTRIYGTAFEKKSELDEYIVRMEEAKRRDHRKLGKELDLFDIFDEGPGFPFFFPKGMVLRNTLEDFWRKEHTLAGYEEVKTPMILNQELWHRSGHWDHYKDNMYVVKIDNEDYAIKPMNCPGGMLVYKRKPHSYRDLPERMAELGLVHRHELSGALHGLMRVRCFTQDDAHIFMTPDQIEEEIEGVVRLIDKFYKVFGFKYKLELSTRPENSMGTDEQWETATNALKRALNVLGKDYEINEGDGAFYGPKIDFHLEDSIGRTWQCGTIQLDFQMPERFDLTYVGQDGEKHRPVMIHRVVFGSIERFIAILTEHYAGAFPLWLAPVQVKIVPISEVQADYAHQVCEKLVNMGIRAEVDDRNEKMGYRIREAQLQKIPYMLVLGENEKQSGTVAVRNRKKGDLGVMSFDDLANKLLKEIAEKSADM